MRILVTGASGFAGGHLEDSVRRICGAGAEIVRTAPSFSNRAEALDITDAEAVADALRRHRPTHLLNLAGVAAPAAAGRDPDMAWRVHLEGVRRLAAGLIEHAPETVMVNAGSGLVYGASFAPGTPVDETAALLPLDEYGASKAAGDLALGVAARRGLRCILMRPFNHSGAGQTEDFVIPAFAAQIARIEAGLAEPVIGVGNIDARRDFLDVHDVCDAYCLALRAGATLEPGLVLNVASGVPRRIGDMLETLLALSEVPIRVEPDPARMRPSDLPTAVGDAARAHATLGWSPRVPFEETLARVLDDLRTRVRDGAGPREPG